MANSLKIHNTTLQDQVWDIFSEAVRKVSKPVAAVFGINCNMRTGECRRELGLGRVQWEVIGLLSLSYVDTRYGALRPGSLTMKITVIS